MLRSSAQHSRGSSLDGRSPFGCDSSCALSNDCSVGVGAINLLRSAALNGVSEVAALSYLRLQHAAQRARRGRERQPCCAARLRRRGDSHRSALPCRNIIDGHSRGRGGATGGGLARAPEACGAGAHLHAEAATPRAKDALVDELKNIARLHEAQLAKALGEAVEVTSRARAPGTQTLTCLGT